MYVFLICIIVKRFEPQGRHFINLLYYYYYYYYYYYCVNKDATSPPRKESPQGHGNGSLKTEIDNRNQRRWTRTFPYFNQTESWAADLTPVVTMLLTLRGRLRHTSRETFGLRHYRYQHPARFDPVYCHDAVRASGSGFSRKQLLE